MSDEKWAYLLFDPVTNNYKIKIEYSIRKPGKLEWEERIDSYTVDDFLKEYPNYSDKVRELRELIETETKQL